MFSLTYCLSWIFAVCMVSYADMKVIRNKNPLSEANRLADINRSLAGADQQLELSQLKQILLQQGREMEFLRHQLQQQSSDMQALWRLVQELRGRDQQQDTLTRQHELQARGDDGGPLDAVVSQLTQHLTSLEADLQAFKTRTTYDINHMTQQSANDLHSLQVQTTVAIGLLNQTNRVQEAEIREARTSTYVRWGSAICGASELVYSGVVGGSLFNETGAATNYLCLTTSPVFGPHRIPGARLFGAEYKTHDAHANKNPACAVCRTAFSSTVMVPGTNVCTPGWNLEYRGYLMAGGYADQSGSEFICVDHTLDHTQNGDLVQEGKSLFYTVTRCGSLPCSPYENDRIVTCAVCSK